MPTKILDAEPRIIIYCADFFELLQSVVCSSFIEDNQKKSVRILCSRIEPFILKKEMRRRLDYDESLEKSVKVFIKLLSQEAINCQAYGLAKPTESPKQQREREHPKNAPAPSVPKAPLKKPKPLCPYPPHKENGFRHFLKAFRDCPKDQKDKLFEDLRKQKKEGVKRTTPAADKEAQSSVIFNATLDDKVRTTVCADICSAVTLMNAKMLVKIQKASTNIKVEKLPTQKTFNMVARNSDGSRTTISCGKAVTLDTDLHIRHGSALILRSLRWLVTPKAVQEPLLGRPVLESLGLDCHKVLAAVVDRHGGAIDVSTLVGNESDFSPGCIGRVLDGFFFSDGGADDTDLDEDDGWLDLGPEDSVKKERVLKSKLQEAKDHGIPI